MVARSKWSSKGTPLDPRFKRPVKVSLKEKKTSSSSSNTSSSSHKLVPLKRPSAQEDFQETPRVFVPKSIQRGGDRSVSIHSRRTDRHFPSVPAVLPSSSLDQGHVQATPREMQTISTVIDTILRRQHSVQPRHAEPTIEKLGATGNRNPSRASQPGRAYPQRSLRSHISSRGRFAKKEFAAETKLQKALKGGKGKADPPRFTEAKGTKGHAKGNGKGAPKGGKEKADESKVVRLWMANWL